MNYLEKINVQKYKVVFIDQCAFFKDSCLKESIAEDVCPLLLHTLVPYYYTYTNGGNFSWTEEAGKVDVQCPNPDGRVETVVVKEKESLFFEITSVAGDCCAHYIPKKVVDLTACFRHLCPLMFDVLFPWLLQGIKGQVELRCPGCKGKKGLRFKLMEIENENQ